MCYIYDLIKIALKKSGTCWVNLGDTYSAGGGISGVPKDWKSISTSNRDKYPQNSPAKKVEGFKPKCLLMLPQRFAIEMINRGWILRNTIIWHKPSCMPSSAKDRFTVDHEYVYFFVKNKKYWFEQQREPVKESTITRTNYSFAKKRTYDLNIHKLRGNIGANDQIREGRKEMQQTIDVNVGRNMRTVWTINTQPTKEFHFATFPFKLVEPMILAGCPEYICSKCGKPREKIVEIIRPSEYEPSEWDEKHGKGCGGQSFSRNRPLSKIFDVALKTKQCFKGYSNCGCNAGFEAGTVLDPFAGIGTTLLTAWKLGRNYVGFELSEKYCEMAKKRMSQTKTKRIDSYLIKNNCLNTQIM